MIALSPLLFGPAMALAIVAYFGSCAFLARFVKHHVHLAGRGAPHARRVRSPRNAPQRAE